MTDSFRRYARRTLLIATAIVLAFGAFNLLIDPYNYFGLNRLGVYISAEREAKARFIRTQPHNAVILGNSKAAMIPVGPLERFRFFNAAFSGAEPYEMQQFVEHFVDSEELVLLSIDLGQYDKTDVREDRFAPWRLEDILDKTLNLRTFEYSVRTISSHVRHEETHVASDGSVNTGKWFEKMDREDPQRANWAINKFNEDFASYSRAPEFGMASFKRIAQTLRQRGIRCIVFIPPLHGEISGRLAASPGAARLQRWKNELATIFPEIIDLSHSKYSDPAGFFKSDPVHFKPQIGVEFVNREILPRVAARTSSTGNTPAKPVERVK